MPARLKPPTTCHARPQATEIHASGRAGAATQLGVGLDLKNRLWVSHAQAVVSIHHHGSVARWAKWLADKKYGFGSTIRPDVRSVIRTLSDGISLRKSTPMQKIIFILTWGFAPS